MELYETFGEFDSVEEINKTAAGLLKEGDIDSLKVLAKENGIEEDDVEDYINGEFDELATEMMAAEGKITIEKEYLKLTEALEDYADWIIQEAMEDRQLAKAVRKKGKSLAGALGQVLKAAWDIKAPIHKDILKAAGIKCGRVESGSPGMKTTTKLMREYYLGGADNGSEQTAQEN